MFIVQKFSFDDVFFLFFRWKKMLFPIFFGFARKKKIVFLLFYSQYYFCLAEEAFSATEM